MSEIQGGVPRGINDLAEGELLPLFIVHEVHT